MLLLPGFSPGKSQDIQVDKPEEQAKPIEQPAEEPPHRLSQWLTYYYKNPHSDSDIEYIKEIFQIGLFNASNSTPLTMFLAEFFRQNEARIPGWEKQLHQIPQAQDHLLLRALWQANSGATLKVLARWPDKNREKTIQTIKQTPPVDLETLSISSPEMLDMLWATFFASGNPRHVERIISVLDLPTNSVQKQARVDNLLLVGAAKWSLSSNAVQHELVHETCERFANSDNPVINKAIGEILERVKVIEAQKSKSDTR
ncbi:MAG: hypothetical protein ABW092_11775 [Candidatus Thiodiazotropha sp.]